MQKASIKGWYMDPAPPPDIINGEKEYKAEEVWEHWKQDRETQFLVYWKRYGNKHDQWIAETGSPYAQKAIQDY